MKKETIETNGRRVTLYVDECPDRYGQLRVSVTVNGALTDADVEIFSACINDKSES